MIKDALYDQNASRGRFNCVTRLSVCYCETRVRSKAPNAISHER